MPVAIHSRRYPVRTETVRAIYMDLADDFGLQGFRWVFVLHNHLGPANNLALDQAADYFHDTYGGRFDSRSVPRVSAASSIPPYEVEQQKRQLEWPQKHGGLR